MKRALLSLSFIIFYLSFSSVAAQSQGWPSQYGGVMLQGFYWDSYDDSQWTALMAQTERLKGTFDLVWLPQSGYCGGQSMGYDDLYWFPGHYDSSFGTETQLRQLISTFKQNGIKTLADVVVNHRRSLSTWTDFPAETYKGVTYQLTYNDICADDEAARNGHQVGPNKDTGEGWDGMRDLDHKSQNVQTSVKAYLGMLLDDMGYAGFRYDMVKVYSPEYTAMYNASSRPEFSVGECWDGTSTIRNWIDRTKGSDGQPQSAAFDFQFRYTVRNAMNNAGSYNRLSQQNDGNWPLVSSNYESGKYRRWAVTFVENHDTERRSNAAQDPLKRDTLAANAYLLAMPGTPCVFYKHWLSYPSQIKAMAAARKYAGINNESSYSNFRSATNYYANVIKTDGQNRLLVVVGDVSANEANVNSQQWAKILEGYHYAYYLPTSLETVYADLPSGTYEGEQQVRISTVSAHENAQLTYTLNGEKKYDVVSGHKVLKLGVGTHTLSLSLMYNEKEVGNPIVLTYVIKEKESEQPADIPSFCTVNEGEMCAFFEAPATWTQTIKCWAWNNSENFTGGTWPGQECTLLGTAANGNKVWKWTYSGSLTTRPTGIIFNNNGSPQTADLDFVNGGYYNKDGQKGVVTGITNIRESATKQALYDLQGRRIGHDMPLKKGIYIKNNKKVLVR